MRSRPKSRRYGAARREQRARLLRRVAGLVLVSATVLVTLVLTAFGSGPATAPATAPQRILGGLPETGPPRPQVVALRGSLRLALPVAQARVTAIGFHPAGAGTLALEPVGRRGNRGLLQRLVERIVGGRGSGLTWYQLEGDGGPATSGLDVGAAPGTDVYAPVDGTVIAIEEYVLDGRRYGERVDLQPASTPSLVVSLTRLGAAADLSVGDAVVAARSRLGRVLDLSGVERQALARYTQDAGNHVTIEVRPTAPQTLG